jgi:hypothetical protein
MGAGLGILVLLILPVAGAGVWASDSPLEQVMATPDDLVTELYDLVTFEAGTTPDWNRVKALFLEEAVIVLRTSGDSTTIFTRDGFVEDFVQFIEKSDVRKTGFRETIVRRHTMIYGDLAQVLVLFEAEIPGSGRPPQRGIDNIQLSKRPDGWRIVSITNEIAWPDKPLPPVLEE